MQRVVLYEVSLEHVVAEQDNFENLSESINRSTLLTTAIGSSTARTERTSYAARARTT